MVTAVSWRPALAAAACVTALVPGPAAPAYAHGAVDITVHSDGAGAVWATVRWADGHPVAEGLAGLVLANGDGGRIGPAPMRRVAGQPGLLSYGDQLPAGTWEVAVDVGAPGIGHCDAVVRVGRAGAPAGPTETRCAATISQGPSGPDNGAAPDDGGFRAAPATGSSPLTTMVVGGVVVLVGGAAWALRRHRRR